MTKHQVKIDHNWFNDRYSGEEADDGCANELSIYQQPNPDRLQLLLSNLDFAGRAHDNTFSLTRQDARQLADFLERWLQE